MTAARYGRMRVGRCLPVDYYVGCFADVLDHAEQRCNGRSSCIISVPDAELFRIQPCRKDLVAYLEAAYRCVAGRHADVTRRRPHRSDSYGVNLAGILGDVGGGYRRLGGRARGAPSSENKYDFFYLKWRLLVTCKFWAVFLSVPSSEKKC